MNALRRRIQAIEQRRSRQRAELACGDLARADRERQAAIAELWDALEAAYPAEGYVRTGAGSIELCDFDRLITEASQRVEDGMPSEQDLAALALLPRDALRVMGWTPADALTLIGAIHRPGLTLQEWRSLPASRHPAGPDLSDGQLSEELKRLGLSDCLAPAAL
jgi:hypothetical protein